jgi:hypothetical protein
LHDAADFVAGEVALFCQGLGDRIDVFAVAFYQFGCAVFESPKMLFDLAPQIWIGADRCERIF